MDNRRQSVPLPAAARERTCLLTAGLAEQAVPELALSADLGSAPWAEFDTEMERLYAVMNEGMEPDLGG